MPKKPVDGSQSWSIYDRQPWREIPQEEIVQLCDMFKIKDRKDFCEKLIPEISAIYRNNKRQFEIRIPTLTKRIELAKDFEKATSDLLASFKRLGSVMQEPIARMNVSRKEFAGLDAAKLNLVTKNMLNSEMGGTHFLDLQTFFDALLMLNKNAEALPAYFAELREEHGNITPMKNQARETLMSNIFQFWEEERGSKMTRLFDDYDDKTDKKAMIPANEATRFCVAVAQMIDPALTVSIIDKMMKDEIQRTQSNSIT